MAELEKEKPAKKPMSSEFQKEWAKSLSLPLTVFQEPMFSYFLHLYEPLLNSQTKWEVFVETVKKVGGQSGYNKQKKDFVTNFRKFIEEREFYQHLLHDDLNHIYEKENIRWAKVRNDVYDFPKEGEKGENEEKNREPGKERSQKGQQHSKSPKQKGESTQKKDEQEGGAKEKGKEEGEEVEGDQKATDEILQRMVKTYFHNCFNEGNLDKKLISLDLKKGNFQALKYYATYYHKHIKGSNSNTTTSSTATATATATTGPSNAETSTTTPDDEFLQAKSYEELCSKFTSLGPLIQSKFERQVIFGKLHPTKQQAVQKLIMKKILTVLFEKHRLPPSLFLSWSNDEIILEATGDKYEEYKSMVKKIVEEDEELKAFQIRFEPFEIYKKAFKRENLEFSFFAKVDSETGKLISFKNLQPIHYALAYKLWFEKEVEDYDYYFTFEGQVAKFVFS